MLTATKQLIGLVATIQHLLDRTHASLQEAQENEEQNFNCRFWKRGEKMKNDNFLFIAVSDKVTRTPKLEYAFDELYVALEKVPTNNDYET